MSLYQEMSIRIISDLIRDLNMVDWQAAGIVGNFAVETGKFKYMQELNPVVKGSKGGYGWAQWTGPRRRAFEAWCKQQGLSPDSYEGNYGFLLHELKTTEKAALNVLLHTQDVDEAAYVFMAKFERPGIKHEEKRIQYAKEALQHYRNKTPVAETTTAGGVIVAGTTLAINNPTYWPYILGGAIVVAIIGVIAVRWFKKRKIQNAIVNVDPAKRVL